MERDLNSLVAATTHMFSRQSSCNWKIQSISESSAVHASQLSKIEGITREAETNFHKWKVAAGSAANDQKGMGDLNHWLRRMEDEIEHLLLTLERCET